MGEFFRRLHYLLHRRRLDRELADDMEFHREMAAGEGRNNFGNALLLREQARDAWGWTWIDRLGQDLRYAVRVLRQSPGFTLAAVVMLAIGLGANIAAFGFFDLVVLRPLNVSDPASLLRFHRRSPQRFADVLPYPEFAFVRDNTRTLSAVLALNLTRLTLRGEPKQREAQFVTANYFEQLGAVPLLGRGFDGTADNHPGAPPVAVLSEGFWRSHFGADPAIIGRAIYLNGKPATVIGVMPRTFNGLCMETPPLWVPLEQHTRFIDGSTLLTDWSGDSKGVMMFGRLTAGVSPQAVKEEILRLTAELHRQHPNDIWEKEELKSEPGGYITGLLHGGRRGTGPDEDSELYRIFGLIGALSVLILTVTCANLGSLLLARGVAREREMSIRSAVGAGTARLVRQLLTESVLLSLLGAGGGVLSGYVVLNRLLAASGAPEWLDASPDWRVAAFAFGIGLFAVALFGLTPALATVRRDRRTHSRQFLIGAQVAASCVLVIVAALLGRAANHAVSEGPGFDYQQVLTIEPSLDQHGYSPARARAYLDSLESRLRAIPGVESVSLSLSPPLGRRTESAGLRENGRFADVEMHRVSPEFLHTIGLPLVRGRNLWPGEQNAVLVSESLARILWPGQDALGRKLPLGAGLTVAGITRSARLNRLQDSDSVEIYLPIAAEELPSTAVVVRTRRHPEDVARAITAVAAGVAPDVFPEVHLLSARFRSKVQSAEYTALTVSVLGGIANLLACLGIVGVVAYTVSQRTREIGIRIALGCSAGHVIAIALRRLTLPVCAGLVLGIGGAVAFSRYLRQMLYGISSLDPMSYCLAVGVFLATVLLAAIPPVRKALRIDPVQALRHE